MLPQSWRGGGSFAIPPFVTKSEHFPKIVLGSCLMEKVLCYVFFSDLGAVRDRPPWRIDGDGKLADSNYSHKPSIKI